VNVSVAAGVALFMWRRSLRRKIFARCVVGSGHHLVDCLEHEKPAGLRIDCAEKRSGVTTSMTAIACSDGPLELREQSPPQSRRVLKIRRRAPECLSRADPGDDPLPRVAADVQNQVPNGIFVLGAAAQI